MDRRFFLKAVAALAATPAIAVPDFRIIAPQDLLLPGDTWFANVREWSAFDVFRDRHVYRWDMFNGTTQWSVNMEVANPRELTEARTCAAAMLADTLRAEGVNLRDLRPLPALDNLPRSIRIRA
jgi:hypothetical protein